MLCYTIGYSYIHAKILYIPHKEALMKKNEEAARITNMTEGSPIRLIIAFALPLMIGNLFQHIYNLVDTMIAGRYLGSEAIAAIGSVSVIYSLLVNCTWGLNNGYCIILSRFFGAGEKKLFQKAAAAMITLNLTIALLLTSVFLLFLKPAMRLLKTPDDIFAQAYLYIVIIIAGLITTVLYDACSGYLRAVGNGKTTLYFLIFSSLLNLFLDVLFVVILKTGIGGTALATVIAQAVSALLCGIYIFKNYREYLPVGEDFRFHKDIMKEMFFTGLSMALMESVVSMGSLILQRAINHLGTALITAYTTSCRIREVITIPLGAIAGAGSTFVGQNYGAGKYRRIVEGNRKMLLMEFLWSLLSIVLTCLLGKPIILWVTAASNETILSGALLNLWVSALCFFPLGVLFVLRNSMQAMGHKILPVVSSAIELTVKIVSACFIVPAFGYSGVVAAEPVTWCLCAVFLSIFYKTVGHQRRPET